MINEIYREPNYTIVDKDTTTDPRIQRAGIRQGCPLSPYLFIMLVTVIMYDVEKGLTEQELDIVENKLHKQVSGKSFYADDTIIMTKTAEAVELMLHKIETESHKYALKLNQGKRLHIQMNAIRRIHSRQGNAVSSQTQADYLLKHRGPQTRAPAQNSGHMENSTEIRSPMGEIKSQHHMENKSL